MIYNTVFKKFLKKATEKFGNKFDYSLVEYKSKTEKVKIKCPKHGIFEQVPYSHLISDYGCPTCAKENTYKIKLEDFIKEAKEKHNNKYDYSLIKEDIQNKYNEIEIICPTHGQFKQVAGVHMRGHGCAKCRSEGNSKRFALTNEEFINKANTIHNNKFDYSKVNYINSATQIEIICPIHGSFLQTPINHLSSKHGCAKCGFDSLAKQRTYSNEQFIEKARKKHGDLYSYEKVNYTGAFNKVIITCKKHGDFFQGGHDHLMGYGCNQCAIEKNTIAQTSNNEEFIEKANQKHNNKFIYDNIKYVNNLSVLDIICPVHGLFKQTASLHLFSKHACNQCSRENRIIVTKNTYIERFVKEYLDTLNISYEENDRKILNGKEIDVFIPSKNFGIECHGVYWHSEEMGKTKDYHLNKLKLAESKGITLIQIFETEILKKPRIVKNRIKTLLGLNKYSIYARKCVIKEVENSISKRFLDKYHVQGNCNSSIKLGLFYRNKLVALMTLGKVRKSLGRKAKEGHYELLRFCCIGNFNIVGGASRLLKYFERNYAPKLLISYADKRWSTGNLYKQLGFNHIRNSSPNYWYFMGEEDVVLMHRFQFRKQELPKKLEHFDPELTEWENMMNNGWNRIWDCGNMVFEKNYV